MGKELTPNQQLLEKQLEEIAVQKRKLSLAKPVAPPKMAGATYNSELQNLVKAVQKDINTLIVPMIESLEPQYISDSVVNDRWVDQVMMAFAQMISKWRSPIIAQAASKIAGEFVKSVNQQNQRRFNRNAKAIGIDVFGDNPRLQDILQASALDNSRLIVTIPEQYLNQVQSIVMSNMRAGLLPRNIIGQLREQFGVTKRRAQLIARDQTSKVNGEISKARQEGAGFEFFKWQTAEDIRVRDRHSVLEKKDVGFGPGIYRWDNPPKDAKGVKVIPGSPINCRCVAIPVSRANIKQNKAGA